MEQVDLHRERKRFFDTFGEDEEFLAYCETPARKIEVQWTFEKKQILALIRRQAGEPVSSQFDDDDIEVWMEHYADQDLCHLIVMTSLHMRSRLQQRKSGQPNPDDRSARRRGLGRTQ